MTNSIKELKKIYKVQLYEMCKHLFPNYSAIKLKLNGNIICTIKNSGFLGLFKKVDKFRLVDFLLYHIPKQISLNKWNTLDLFRVFYQEMTVGLPTSSPLTSNHLEGLIAYLFQRSLEVSVVDVSSINTPPTQQTLIRVPLRALPSKFMKKIRLLKERVLIDPDNENRAILRTFTCYLNSITNYLKISALNPAIWILLLQLLKSPAVKHTNFNKLISYPIGVVSQGTPCFL